MGVGEGKGAAVLFYEGKNNEMDVSATMRLACFVWREVEGEVRGAQAITKVQSLGNESDEKQVVCILESVLICLLYQRKK